MRCLHIAEASHRLLGWPEQAGAIAAPKNSARQQHEFVLYALSAQGLMVAASKLRTDKVLPALPWREPSEQKGGTCRHRCAGPLKRMSRRWTTVVE